MQNISHFLSSFNSEIRLGMVGLVETVAITTDLVKGVEETLVMYCLAEDVGDIRT
jgi:hypothetical protein